MSATNGRLRGNGRRRDGGANGRRGDGGANGNRSAVEGAPILITGGAGFVGANLADRLLARGEHVVILDNLSRDGVEHNLEWLRRGRSERLRIVLGDVRDTELVRRTVADCAFVYHFAAQVAVTTSLTAPREDHDINVVGTLNVLEALRGARHRPGIVFASTNKVYGALDGVELTLEGNRYVPADAQIRDHGIDERQPLEFLSPYGCSKGAADQYVLDYCRSFDIAAVVLRMSCIYGPRQHATSDQGWVTYFLSSALRGEGLTIYGDGCQVRDVLYIDDFVEALCAARRELPRLRGRPYNMGGGAENVVSLLEVIDVAEQLSGKPLGLAFAAPRTGDQRYFAADHRRFAEITGWRPEVGPQAGIRSLWQWLRQDAAESPNRPVADRPAGETFA